MNEVEEIKKKIDIVDLVSSYVNLKKAGRNYKAVCPFHNEKTPSFVVSPEKQIWHCFGCHRGGDIFSFWQETYGVEFYEALKSLAERAGVELKGSFRRDGEKTSYKKILYKINALTAAFYHRILLSSKKVEVAKQYLRERGLESGTIKEFGIGFAPDRTALLQEFLRGRGFKDKAMQDAGVVAEKNGRLLDKFRHRIIFPIRDTRGRVVGMMARGLDEQAIPKYLNTPETLIYRKGETVFGLDLARRVIVERDFAIVVEGNMDAITAHQAGFKNTIAVTGTACTESQLALIKRFTHNLVLAFDADGAGQTATRRVVEMALPLGLNLKILSLGKYKDPDEMIRADVKKFTMELKSAASALDFYFGQVEVGSERKSAFSQKKVAKELLSLVNLLTDPIEQDHYLNRLSRLIDVPTAILYESLAGLTRGGAFPKEASPSVKLEITEDKKLSEEWLVPRLIGLGLFSVGHMSRIVDALDGAKIANSQFESVFLKIKKCYNDDVSRFSLSRLGTHLNRSEYDVLKRLVLIIEEKYGGLGDGEIGREIDFYLDLLKRHHRKFDKIRLLREIESAEKNEDSDKVKELTSELIKLRD